MTGKKELEFNKIVSDILKNENKKTDKIRNSKKNNRR